jgi:hypothetical protein
MPRDFIAAALEPITFLPLVSISPALSPTESTSNSNSTLRLKHQAHCKSWPDTLVEDRPPKIEVEDCLIKASIERFAGE